jgi:hypothetical protein
MKALIYDPATGKIDRVQHVPQADTADEVLSHVYGQEASQWSAMSYTGDSLTGKKVDTSTGNLIDDPEYTPPEPAPARIDPLEFLARFQKSELDSISSSSDKLVQKFEQRIDNSTVIVKDSTLTTAMQYLVDNGLLTATRRDEILNF